MTKKLAILLSLLFSTSALALNINEQTTPNETMADAQLIEPNNSNPSDYYSGQNKDQRVVIGNLSSATDIDWYKVELDANYMRPVIFINSNAVIEVQIISSNNSVIANFTHIKNYSYFGAKPYDLNINTPGTYYIKISSLGSTGDYRFGIGKPDYELRTHQATTRGALTLTPTQRSDYKALNVDTDKIAKGAVLTTIYYSGDRQGSVSYFSKKLHYGNSTMHFPNYYSYMNIDPNRNLRLDLISSWGAEISGSVRDNYYGYGSSEFKFYPSVKFTYVFPVTTENFHNMNEFK